MAKTKTKGPAAEAAPAGPVPKPRLKVYYEQTVRPKLGQQFGFMNPHQIPRLVKIVLNVGEGEGMKNAKLLEKLGINVDDDRATADKFDPRHLNKIVD